MDYTEADLRALIERHDEHEEFYRAKLAELLDYEYRAAEGNNGL